MDANQVDSSILFGFTAMKCLGGYGFMRSKAEIYSSHNTAHICLECLTASKQVMAATAGLKPQNVVYITQVKKSKVNSNFTYSE